MSLTIGTRLDPYETLALVGAAGMGEAYRAILGSGATSRSKSCQSTFYGVLAKGAKSIVRLKNSTLLSNKTGVLNGNNRIPGSTTTGTLSPLATHQANR